MDCVLLHVCTSRLSKKGNSVNASNFLFSDRWFDYWWLDGGWTFRIKSQRPFTMWAQAQTSGHGLIKMIVPVQLLSGTRTMVQNVFLVLVFSF
jgi:hypothetical protein